MTEILAITRTGDICLTVFLFLVGLVLIIKGGDWFVDSASKIAEMSGVPQFIIGATVVSIGTTLPELITSSIAAGEGNAAIAIGNAVGSVNANIGLIMAVSLLFLPHAFDKKAYLFKGITMILSIVILFLMCLKGYLNAYLSIILLVVFLVFMAENIIVGKKKRQRINLSTTARIPLPLARTATPPSPETQPTKAQTRMPWPPKTKDERHRKKHYLLYSRHGVYRRRRATSRNFRQQTRGIYGRPRKNRRNHPCRNRHVAARTCHDGYVDYQEKHDLSIGNIIGANVIDICLILPVCAMISGGRLPIEFNSLYIDMPFCIGFTLLAILPAVITKSSHACKAALSLQPTSPI